MNDLRPTLFLAQLSNLLAGNISIVHGVTGSSRTFMGEEFAGIDAVRIALARIQAGQSDITLVGGAHNGERKDLFMLYETGGYNLRAPFRPVWERGTGRRLRTRFARRISGSGERDHAKARNAEPIAKLVGRAGRRAASRKPGTSPLRSKDVGQIAASSPDRTDHAAFISGATGAEPAYRRGTRVSWPSTRPFPSAPRVPILVMDLSRSFR